MRKTIEKIFRLVMCVLLVVSSLNISTGVVYAAEKTNLSEGVVGKESISNINVLEDNIVLQNLSRGKSTWASKVNSKYPAANSVDGNRSTVWSPGTTARNDITVDLGETCYIDSVTLTSSWSSFKYKIEISNDNENYIMFYDHTAELGLPNDEIAKPTEGMYGRYLKITVTQTDPSRTNWVALAEIDAMGYPISEIQSMEMSDYSLMKGLTGKAIVNFVPSNVDRRLTWTSDDTSVITVDEKTGIITAVSIGETTLHAVAENGVQTSCKVTVEPRKADEITLNKDKMYLSVGGQSGIVMAEIAPNYADVELVWSSSNDSIATVVSGEISPESVGSCTITVTDTISGKEMNLDVEVLENPIYADTITLSQESITLQPGINDNVKLEALLTPIDVTETEITWSSADENIVTVNEEGIITAVSEGETQITASVISKLDGSTISASCTVKVEIPVTGISFLQEELYLILSEGSKSIPVMISPEGASNKSILWVVENEAIAKVENDTIIPIKTGITTITATTVDGGYTASTKVTVIRASEEIKLSSNMLTLQAGGPTATLKATVLPNTATTKKVIWSSSDVTVATVAHGIITPLAAGTAEITVTSIDGKSSATCVVTIIDEKVEVANIFLDESMVNMLPGGESASLTLTILPENATNKNVKWTSADKRIALVQDGIITSVGVGTTTITAEVDGKQVSALVKVHATGNLITNDTMYVDTDGNPIYSSGGGIIKVEDTYYWYGVKYTEFVTYGNEPTLDNASRSNTTHFEAITCYSSKDLVNWKFENEIFKKDTDVRTGYISWLGRLGIMYNAKNNNYIIAAQCWAYDGDVELNNGGEIYVKGETPTSDFEFAGFQKAGEGGLGQIANNYTGDQTSFIDDDGTAYIIASSAKGRSNMYICTLNEDYTWVESAHRVYNGAGKEGNCMFKYNGRYYIASSDLHGWNSSPAYVIMSQSDNIFGPYTSPAIPMKNSIESYSHVSQTGFFASVKGSEQNTIIFAGDRWSGFAGNGMGFHSWVPLSFEADGTPIFNDLTQFTLDEKTGIWEVGPNNNYVTNPAFEADRVGILDPKGWDVSDNRNGSANHNVNGSPYSGRWYWQQQYSDSYTATISQQITDLPEGEYTLKAWVKSSGGQNTCNLYIKNYGGDEINVSLTDPLNDWTQITVVENLKITGGTCEIGLYSDALANQYIIMDEVTLIKTSDRKITIPQTQSASLDPAFASFDKNSDEDLTTMISWGDATYITDIKNTGVSIGADAYAVSGSAIAVSGSALTIKKEYLATQPEGVLVLFVEFDQGEVVPFVIEITDSKDSTIISAVISPDTGNFDKKLENQADVNAVITWNDAVAVTDIKTAGVSIGAEAYAVTGSAIAVSGSALTIKKGYLATQPEGALILSVEFEQGEAATFVIYITDTTDSVEPSIVSAVINPGIRNFDKKIENQADVSTEITWNDAASVIDIKTGGVSIGTEAYVVTGSAIAVSGSALTIKKDFLATQPEGTLILSVEFDQGEAATFIINITDTTEYTEPDMVSAIIHTLVSNYDKHFIKRADIITEVTWNDASAVTEIKVNGVSISTNAYAINGDQLIIKKEYLLTQPLGYLTLAIEFNVGNSATMVIQIKDTTPVVTPTQPTTPVMDPKPIPAPKLIGTDDANISGVTGTAKFNIYEPDVDGKMKALVELPSEEILKEIQKNGTTEKPVEITIPVSSKKLLDKINDDKVKEVEVTVQVPKAISSNEKATTMINLDKELLKAAKEAKKDLTVSVVDEEGKVNYSWSFTGEDLINSNQDISEVNLSLEVKALEQEEQLETLQLNKKDVKGMVVNFSHEGILPAQATVRIYVGNQESMEEGDKIYLYHFNKTTGKLETLPYSSGYEVDKDGYITVHILHCSAYVVLSDKVYSSMITSLKKQIIITPAKKTIYYGGTTDTITNIQIDLPPTLELVDSLKDETKSSAVGAITVTYRSSNDKIATVDGNGKITAKGKGIAYITTTVKLYSGKSKTVITTIVVKEPYVKLTSSVTHMKVGETFTFEAKAYGIKFDDVKWTTTKKSVVVIDKKSGKAFAKSGGTDYIMAKIGNETIKIKVVVK